MRRVLRKRHAFRIAFVPFGGQLRDLDVLVTMEWLRLADLYRLEGILRRESVFRQYLNAFRLKPDLRGNGMVVFRHCRQLHLRLRGRIFLKLVPHARNRGERYRGKDVGRRFARDELQAV